MKQYNYYEAVKKDVRKYIKNEIDLDDWKGQREELEEKLNRDLFKNDSVTGMESKSYTANGYNAEKNLCNNIDLLEEASEYYNIFTLDKSAEFLDVIIRCYLLASSIYIVLNELEENGVLE